MTSRFCTLTSKFFSLEVMTSWKFRSIENPAPSPIVHNRVQPHTPPRYLPSASSACKAARSHTWLSSFRGSRARARWRRPAITSSPSSPQRWQLGCRWTTGRGHSSASTPIPSSGWGVTSAYSGTTVCVWDEWVTMVVSSTDAICVLTIKLTIRLHCG